MAKKSSNSGCGGLIGACILLVLAVKFWFVVLPLIGVSLIVAAIASVSQKHKALREETEYVRHRLAQTCVVNPDRPLAAIPDTEIREITASPESYRGILVSRTALGKKESAQVERADAAAHAILTSPEYLAGTCGNLPAHAIFRHLWEIAFSLRDISECRAGLPTIGVGPITAPVVAAQRQAVEIAEASVTKRISALLNFAAAVGKADAARRDWEMAQKLAGNNDRYLNLIARTAADEHAVTDLARENLNAERAAQALNQTLRSAALAAEVLAL